MFEGYFITKCPSYKAYTVYDLISKDSEQVHKATYIAKVPPIQATKALKAGRGIALPNLRPRH